MPTNAFAVFHVNVAYPRFFYDLLEKQSHHRSDAGEISLECMSDSDLLNRLLVINRWSELRQAQEFWKSDRARSDIESWNSVELPAIRFYIG
jgi:hypothetical protein